MDVNRLFLIMMSAIFVNNFIFSRFLGLCPFFGVSKKMSSAIGMGFAVMFVMVMSTAVIYPINLLLVYLGIDFLQVIVFILVIAGFVQLVEIFLKKMAPVLYHALGIYLPLITTNCAILGAVFLVLKEDYTFVEALVFSLAAGLGFTLALIMMASVRERLDLAKVPKAFKGLPIAFVSAALMSMAMYAFVGFVK